jgi:hypothetical protein
MDSTLEAPINQPDPEEVAGDDERASLIADELREAIRRKVTPPAL